MDDSVEDHRQCWSTWKVLVVGCHLPAYQALSCWGLEQSPMRDMLHQQLIALQRSIRDQHSTNKHLLNQLLKYRSYLSHKRKLEHAPPRSPCTSRVSTPFPSPAWLETSYTVYSQVCSGTVATGGLLCGRGCAACYAMCAAI